MNRISRKVAARIITVILLAILIMPAGHYFVYAQDDGHIGYEEIVIDGITYKKAITDFQKIPQPEESGFPSSYGEDAYPEYSQQEPYQSLDGQTVSTTMICEDASISKCADIGTAEAVAIGEPVYGDLYNGVSLWQEVTYNGKTYYVPLSELNNTSETSADPVTYSGGDSQPQYTTSQKGNIVSGSYLVAEAYLSDLISPTAILKKADKIKQNISKTRITQIRDNMNKAHDKDGMTALETCVWASRNNDGNKKPFSEYIIVMDWCKKKGISGKDVEKKLNQDKGKKEEPKKEDFKIDKSYSVSIKKDAKTTLFKHFEFKKSGSAQSNKSNGKPLYIFVHGWGGNPSIWAEGMSRLIAGNPQILFLDWREIATRDSTDIAPYYEATWVDAVADEATKALKEWGIDNSNTTIIGHSLGTILGAKLAVKLEGIGNTSGIKNIKMIMLDPAAYAWEYRTDRQGTTFGSFGGNGLCIVADDSIPGSETLMNTCKEKYLIEYDDPVNNPAIDDYVDFTVDEIEDSNVLTTAYKIITGSIVKFIVQKIAINTGKYAYNEVKESITNHLWVYSTYKEIIRNPFYNNILHPDNVLSSDSSFNLENGKINGVIYTQKDQPETIKYLKTIQNKAGLDDKYSMFGNTNSNAFECDENMNCLMYTSTGNDEISQTEYTKSVYVTDFDEKNDKIMLDMHGMNYFIKMPNVTDESWYQSGAANIGIIPISGRQVALEGVAFEKVYGWVKIADGTYIKKDGTKPTDSELKSLRKENPIQIK